MIKRTIERRLDALEGETPGSVRGWVEGCMAEGFNYQVEYGDPAHSEEVCVLEDGRVRYYADEEDVPAWIDVDEGLPIQ